MRIIFIFNIDQNHNIFHHIPTMGEARKTHRAKITHKLAKYVRARSVSLNPRDSAQLPSVGHLAHGGPQQKKLRNNAKTWYPADDEKVHFKRKRCQPKPSKGKAVAPGTIVILLSGKHRGRRVIALKKLASGNLLVTGPYNVNGVPLKRVNPCYTIVTSTKVALDGVNVANIDDGWFKSFKQYRPKELKNASETRQKRVFELKKKEDAWKVEAKKVQKTLDAELEKNVKKTEGIKGYLKTKFTLYNNTKPHELKF